MKLSILNIRDVLMKKAEAMLYFIVFLIGLVVVVYMAKMSFIYGRKMFSIHEVKPSSWVDNMVIIISAIAYTIWFILEYSKYRL